MGGWQRWNDGAEPSGAPDWRATPRGDGLWAKQPALLNQSLLHGQHGGVAPVTGPQSLPQLPQVSFDGFG